MLRDVGLFWTWMDVTNRQLMEFGQEEVAEVIITCPVPWGDFGRGITAIVRSA